MIAHAVIGLGLWLFAGVTVNAETLVTTGKTGAGEFYVRYVQRAAWDIFAVCEADKACYPDIRILIDELRYYKPPETVKLVFRTSQQLGTRLYWWEGNSAVAVNLDLLYIARNGVLEPWLNSEAVDFLMRIWGEKLRWSSHNAMLGANRVSDALARTVTRVPLSESHLKHFSFAWFRGPGSALILEDTSMSELSVTTEVPFRTLLSCGPSTGAETQMENLKVMTAKWAPVSRWSTEREMLTLNGGLEYECDHPIHRRRVRYASNYRVQVDAIKKEGQYVLNANTLRIFQNNISVLTGK